MSLLMPKANNNEETDMTLIFKKELYSKIALLKAAYAFTDRAYIHIDCTETEYIVILDSKDNSDCLCEKEFENEMLCQSLRHEIFEQTKDIRKMLVARSISSSMIVSSSDESLKDSGNPNEILKDWFESEIETQ